MIRLAAIVIFAAFAVGVILAGILRKQNVPLQEDSSFPPEAAAVRATLAPNATRASTAAAEAKLPTSVTLSIRFKPFENYLGITHIALGSDPIPLPTAEPSNKEGFFVLDVEAHAVTGNVMYKTWLSVDAVTFMIDPDTNPEHNLSVTLPYTPGMTVTFHEPSSGRVYGESTLP